MTITPRISRRLGTMVAYGFRDGGLAHDLEIARRLGANCLEIFPQWRREPDPGLLAREAADAGFAVHSAHGCWGGQSIAARRVDLGSVDPDVRRESLDDLRRCIDWLARAGGRCLVVHPGGLSDPTEADGRSRALVDGLGALADHAGGSGVVVCVENMPPGVNPGSRMADLRSIVDELDRPEVGLAVDTGHAHLVSSVREETLAAGPRLVTTHVHDNQGRQDVHLPPGSGTIDWQGWVEALDEVKYEGPIMLECIRHLRDHPGSVSDDFLRRIASIAGNP